MDSDTLFVRNGIRRQSGASAVEFALLLPLLITLTYSMFVYSYVFVIFESINHAAQQGAEAAVAVDPSPDAGYEARLTSYARTMAAASLSWLPDRLKAGSIGPNGSLIEVVPCPEGGGGGGNCPDADVGGQAVAVTITFQLLSPAVLPVLTLPGIGTVPPLPASMKGVGVALVSG